jgi:predicted RNase H-like nuclease
MIAGVDGYKLGWVAAIDVADRTTTVETFDSFSSILARADLSLIVIDIPIGLLPAGSRRCDQEARRVLGFPRRSSVFPAPIRPMLEARHWQEACDIRLRIEGKRCNKQVMGILPKIREVDQELRPGLQRRVREGHPEVSFALMNCGSAMRYRKSTPQGRPERLHLLKPHFPDVMENLATIPRATTDVVDA